LLAIGRSKPPRITDRSSDVKIQQLETLLLDHTYGKF